MNVKTKKIEIRPRCFDRNKTTKGSNKFLKNTVYWNKLKLNCDASTENYRKYERDIHNYFCIKINIKNF